MEVVFPSLATAARRCNLNAGELAEAVLHGIDCGMSEMEAMRMSIVETLQRRGAYRGRVKQAIEDGTIFQMSADDVRKDCGTCHHEPEWVKCLAGDTWLHGYCAATGWGLNKRRRYCYCWDARIVNCEAWESAGANTP